MKLIILVMYFFSMNLMAQVVLRSEPKSGRVNFETVSRSSFLLVKGTGEEIRSDLKINQNKISGEVSFLLDSLKSDMPARDKLMKEKYLQTQIFPEAKIVFQDFELPAGWSLQNKKVARSSFRAKLYLHGVEKELTGVYSVDPEGFKVTADFEIKLSDFKIQTPEYQGIAVADFIKINVTIDKMNIIK